MRFSSKLALGLVIAACVAAALHGQETKPPAQYPATAAGARAFLEEANRELLRLGNAGEPRRVDPAHLHHA